MDVLPARDSSNPADSTETVIQIPGPPPSFAELCVPLRPALYAKAMQLLRSAPAAEDLVQDALLKTLAEWDSFRPGDDAADRAGAWCHRIMMNLFRDRYRARARHTEALEVWHVDAMESTLAVEAFAAPDDERMSLAVRRALEDLEPDHREVVERVDLRGESYREITEALGVSIGTVKSRLHRARKRLAEALG